MKVALLGFGTVGKGVCTILQQAPASEVRALSLAHILIRKGKERTLPQMCDDYETILQDASCSCVIEVMGGIEPAYTYVKQALQAGKHVVTANKALIAAYLPELCALAKANGVQLRFEASCGGGIPWLHTLLQVKRIDAISEIRGILNGTANYILHQMERHDLDFALALRQAQEAGYAEADPSADIDGIDTANKAVISASLAFDTICRRDFAIHGIRTLRKADLHFQQQQGCRIRLMLHAAAKDDAYCCTVVPTILPLSALDAHVPGVFNRITLHGETIGDLSLYGQGAGALPTGHAIIADLLAIAADEAWKLPAFTAKRFDPSLLIGDYILRTKEGIIAYPAIDPMQMQDILQDAKRRDPQALLLRKQVSA